MKLATSILTIALLTWTAVLGLYSLKLYKLAATLETQCTISPPPSRPLGSLSV